MLVGACNARRATKTSISLKQSKGDRPQPFSPGVPTGEGHLQPRGRGCRRARVSPGRGVRPPAERRRTAGNFWREAAGPARGSARGAAPSPAGAPRRLPLPTPSPRVSVPLPTASNHYSAPSALNMHGRVTSCESGSVPREGANIYINVPWVGRGGREVGRGSAAPVIAAYVGNTGELLLCLLSFAASIEGVLTRGGGGRDRRMPGGSNPEAAGTPARDWHWGPEAVGLEEGTFPQGVWSLPPSTTSLLLERSPFPRL